MSKLTPAQNFRLGYLTGCIDAGLTPEEAARGAEFLVKQADGPFTIAANTISDAGSALASLPGKALGLATTYAAPMVLAPAALALGAYGVGNIAGGMARRAEVAEPVDVKDVQKQELIQSYDWHTAKILHEIKRRRKEQALQGMKFEDMSK